MTTRAQKESQVTELRDNLLRSKATYVSDYRGLSVKEITTLRRNLQKVDADFTVAKNTLIKVALKGEALGEALESQLKGPTGLAICYSDPAAPAKVLADFIKAVKKSELRGGVVEGKAVTADQAKAIAELPSREVLIAKMLGSMNAPITNFVGVLAAMPRSLVLALEAIRKQKAGE
jgi:large subunit ribosomal protein L10